MNSKGLIRWVSLALVLIFDLGYAAPNVLAAVAKLEPKFEVRRVLEEEEKTEGDVLPFAKAKGEKELKVEKKILLHGFDIQSAKVEWNPLMNQNQIRAELTPEGKTAFAKATRNNVGSRLAIILAGKILIAPVIHEPIEGGVFLISGSYTAEEIRDIAAKLNPTGSHTAEK